MTAAFNILFSGVFQGSLYALLAVGLSLAWTMAGVFNFAHGAIMMLGAYFCWHFLDPSGFGLPFLAAVPFALVCVALIGLVLQRLALSPFMGHPQQVLIAVIMTLAAGAFLENAALAIWGPRSKQLPPLVDGTLSIAGQTVSANQCAIILVAPLVLGGVWLLLNRTRLGLMMRAVSQNHQASLLVGLRPSVLYGITFLLAAALGGFAGILLGTFKVMTPGMGNEPLAKAMIVVIFGGIGTVNGPILAAYIVGVIEAASAYFLGLYWTPSILFAILIACLMIRPEGLIAIRQRGLS